MEVLQNRWNKPVPTAVEQDVQKPVQQEKQSQPEPMEVTKSFYMQNNIYYRKSEARWENVYFYLCFKTSSGVPVAPPPPSLGLKNTPKPISETREQHRNAMRKGGLELWISLRRLKISAVFAVTTLALN